MFAFRILDHNRISKINKDHIKDLVTLEEL